MVEISPKFQIMNAETAIPTIGILLFDLGSWSAMEFSTIRVFDGHFIQSPVLVVTSASPGIFSLSSLLLSFDFSKVKYEGEGPQRNP